MMSIVRGSLDTLYPALDQLSMLIWLTATWLAQLGEHQSAEREVMGSNPGWINTQGLSITKKKVTPL